MLFCPCVVPILPYVSMKHVRPLNVEAHRQDGQVRQSGGAALGMSSSGSGQ